MALCKPVQQWQTRKQQPQGYRQYSTVVVLEVLRYAVQAGLQQWQTRKQQPSGSFNLIMLSFNLIMHGLGLPADLVLYARPSIGGKKTTRRNYAAKHDSREPKHPTWQKWHTERKNQCCRPNMAEPIWQQGGRTNMAEPIWQNQSGRTHMAEVAYREAEPDSISRAGEGQHEVPISLLALIALLVPKCPPHLVPEHD